MNRRIYLHDSEYSKASQSKRIQHCCAVLLLQHIFKKLDEDLQGLTIKKTSMGKPYIEGMPIQFNISHSRDTVMCTVSETEVGCDVEYIRPFNVNIVNRFFSSDEIKYIKSIEDNDNRNRSIIRMWTLKESFLKCIGTGMSELNSISIDPDNLCVKYNGSVCENYYFKEYCPLDGFHYSVCAKNNRFGPIEHISIADIFY